MMSCRCWSECVLQQTFQVVFVVYSLAHSRARQVELSADVRGHSGHGLTNAQNRPAKKRYVFMKAQLLFTAWPSFITGMKPDTAGRDKRGDGRVIRGGAY